jgi:hypothetical protein
MVRKRSDERPTGNHNPCHAISCIPGVSNQVYGAATVSNGMSKSRGYPKLGTSTSQHKGWQRSTWFTLCPVGIPRGAGLVRIKSPPTHARKVHHCERGRPMRGGEQSPDEAHGRRRLHSRCATRHKIGMEENSRGPYQVGNDPLGCSAGRSFYRGEKAIPKR